MPFDEPGVGTLLRTALAAGRLRAGAEPHDVALAGTVVLVIGTPVDDTPLPDRGALASVIESLAGRGLVDGQLLILRSTLAPGTTEFVERLLHDLGLRVDLAYCPERLSEGRALRELRSLPQLVAARSLRARQDAAALFSRLTDQIVLLTPEEAELAKLFTNFWRYVSFAAANTMYVVANDHGLDFARIRDAMVHDYARASALPAAGFTGGPCLPWSAEVLGASHPSASGLARASSDINETLPRYVVDRLVARYDLSSMIVGILGMAYKADSDDVRSSPSYELKSLLAAKARHVLTHDPYVQGDPDLSPLDVVLERSDLLVIGAPHSAYRDVAAQVPVHDLSGLRGYGAMI
jgi:UDP-N-acetyl-D-mannosaminuronic acid dehydrogenase